MSSAARAVLHGTAVVLVEGRRSGSAVLVDDRYLVTVRHVLLRRDPTTGRSALARQVEVEFPGAVGGVRTGRLTAVPVELGTGTSDVDLAVLDVGERRPGGLPGPVPVWPAGRLPELVDVFGYPMAEGLLNGVWRGFEVGRPTAAGSVQLVWTEGAGTFPGHSGGPVVDRNSGALVGVLVEHSAQGRFDRFLPITLIARLWPALPRPWLMAGLEGRSHFARRACGQRSRARGGDLFRGRQAALSAVRNWLTDPELPDVPLVVTGQPGAGKSTVLARAVMSLQADRTGPGLAFHARGTTHVELLAAVADLTGIERAETRDELIDALADADAATPWRIAVDALDEAATPQDSSQIAESLTEFAAVPGIRIAVAARPLAAHERQRYLRGGLLAALGVRTPSSVNLVDLDTDRYFDRRGLEQFVAAVLAQEGVGRPGPRGRAWTGYRVEPELRDRLAQVVAGRSDRNYLVAAMTAVALAEVDAPVDPTADDFDARAIPSGVGEVLGKYLDGLPDRDKARTHGLLTALAYARGPGVDDQLWLAFAGALGYAATVPDLDQLRTSAAADYFLQTVPTDDGAVTRLFHQALTDELLAHRPDRRGDERRLVQVLLDRVGAVGGWGSAGTYARQHIADHAAGAGTLPDLLEDPLYLAEANLSRVLPLLAEAPPELARNPITQVLRQVGIRAAPFPAARRARLLALAAAHLGFSATYRKLVGVCAPRFVPRWAHPLGMPHRELTGHTAPVVAVAACRIGGRDVIASGGLDATVRLWDAGSGVLTGQPLSGHGDAVTAVALGRVRGRGVVVSSSRDETVRVWDAGTGLPVGAPLVGHSGWVAAVAVGRVEGREVIVSGGHDSTVRVWDAGTGKLESALRGHTGAVVAVALGRAGGRDVIVSGGHDSTVRVWDAGTGLPVGAPLVGHSDWVAAVAVARLGSRDVIVSGGHDATVRVWDAVTGLPVGPPLVGHSDWVATVVVGRLAGRDVIVTGGWDEAVRVWDAETGTPIGRPLIGHTGAVGAVAIAPGRPEWCEVVVSGGHDGTVRVWEAGNAVGAKPPPAGHSDWIVAVARGGADGHEVIVSGGYDATVQAWDPRTGESVGPPLVGHVSGVEAVAVGRVGDSTVVVSGGRDGTVRCWDAVTGLPSGPPLTGHTGTVVAVAVDRIGNRDVIASADKDAAVRLWDAGTREPISRPLSRHSASAVAVGRVGDRMVVVSGGRDGTVRLRDAVTGKPVGRPLTGHTRAVVAVGVSRVADRDVVVSGSWDETVRVWDAQTGAPIGQPLGGHTDGVEAVAVGWVGDRAAVVTGGWEKIRVRELEGSDVTVLDVLGPVRSVCVTHDGVLCAATGRALCAFTCLAVSAP